MLSPDYMPTLDLPQSERLSALREFIAQAENPEKAREWILDLLDPETDADLLDYLAESTNQPPTQP
jgi:hypothetical protein